MLNKNQSTAAVNGVSLIIVASDVGGQGTTLLSALITLLRRERDPCFRAIAADISGGGSSKFKGLIS